MNRQSSRDRRYNCVVLEGIVPEMHSQNVLFGFDNAWNIKSIVLRDLESHDKDITLMRRLGKMDRLRSYPFKCIEDNQYNYAIKHSFMFDHKLGEYFIAELFKVAAKVINWYLMNYVWRSKIMFWGIMAIS